MDLQLENIKFIQKNGNKILFELSNQQFYIIIPENKDEFYFLETSIILNGFTWLNKVNEYIFDKNPNLQNLLTYIENKYKDQNKSIQKKSVKTDIFNIPELEIDTFDLEERKYRRQLEQIMSTKTSKLNLNINDTTQALFSGKVPGILIMNEFFDLRKKYSKNSNIKINLYDNNIYTWNIKFRNFTNKRLHNELESLNDKYKFDYIEVEVHFHDKLYPGYPPFIQVVRPRLDKGLMNRLTNMKMIQLEYWSPCRGMSFVVNKLYNTLNDHCIIDVDSEMNDIDKYPKGSYHGLEAILIKLASLCDVKDENEPLDNEIYNKVINTGPVSLKPIKRTSSMKKETVWKKGTGYGHDGSSDWDPDEYVKMQEEKDKQIRSVLSIIMDSLHTYTNDEMPIIYNIIQNSYLIPFIKSYLRGANILEMSKRFEMYQFLILFMQILATENSIFLFDRDNSDNNQGIYDLLELLNKEAIQVSKLSKVKSDDTDQDGNYDISIMICSLYDMITPIFSTYLENKTKFQTEEKEKWNQKLEQATSNSSSNLKHQEYQQTMSDLRFDTTKFISSYAYVSELTSGITSKQMAKRLASEYAIMINGLPIFYESSVFVRVNEQDNRCVKILITGPSDTPYDSGCFIFDLFTGSNYPENTPKMLFKNNGNVRFNPNLYNCGKVCLSLLGTWSGSASEKWNPKTSTLQQLFISIQSQILVEQPYFNEPSYESTYCTAAGLETSRQYNCERRWYTLTHAMYNLLINPESYPEFSDVIKKHFTLKKEYILQLCNKWIAEPNNKFEKQTIEIANKLKDLLEKL
ncbi:ubiquitin-conjugating enzyme E2 [Indivirus ILV1]|uniref:E2 ubiquitin-conjugating enzyme n=1 Tax=Indivirus ILV1 TaxID=1977633 RepID=A0A1V0SDA6_9VIRU|nr:ubiquitin-conjugating enzyme E2 [Indivirus ILV1]